MPPVEPEAKAKKKQKEPVSSVTVFDEKPIQTDKSRYVNMPLTDGDKPIYVVSGDRGFDDAGFDENDGTGGSDEQADTNAGNKPQIRVVKGDTFDE